MTDGVRRLPGPAALLDLAGDDAYVRAEVDPAGDTDCWAGPDGVLGWTIPSRRVPGSAHLVAVGDPAGAAGLLGRLAERGAAFGSVSLPRDADRLLPEGTGRLDPRNDWEWLLTETAPPVQQREGEIGWLADEDDTEIAALLTEWSGRQHAMPGGDGVLRWAGARDDCGRLVAVAAHTEHRRGVPHLAAIATRGDVRGRGYGAAVTAWLTRALLDEGTGWVTLGMYSDNAVARRIYLRLGYRVDKRWTSGRLVRPGGPPAN